MAGLTAVRAQRRAAWVGMEMDGHGDRRGQFQTGVTRDESPVRLAPSPNRTPWIRSGVIALKKQSLLVNPVKVLAVAAEPLRSQSR